MIEDGILEGDYVIIEQTSSVHNGEIVVALVDNENATLKRFYNEMIFLITNSPKQTRATLINPA